MTPKRILLVPDGFKGSLSSLGVARAMASGLAEVWPDAQVAQCPLADGGEGTLAALSCTRPGVEVSAPTLGPSGAPLQAGYWCDAEGFSVVEMARASGLGVVRRACPLTACSGGTGLLIRAADAEAPKAIYLGVGGSATVDGGAGCLRALGFKLLDAQGQDLPAGGAALRRLERIVPPARPTLRAPLIVLHDVSSPLLGPQGAAQMFGPQKGASAGDVSTLEVALTRWAVVLHETFGRDPRTCVGGGAGGGIVGGLWAALGAEVRRGFDVVADWVGLDTALTGADLVITGEGKLDVQTAAGKVVAGVLERNSQTSAPAPVWIVAGAFTREGARWCADRAALLPISEGPMSLAQSRAEAPQLIHRAVARAARLVAQMCSQPQP